MLAALGVARLMRFVPRSVMVGFVNALAILIFLSQLPYLIGVPALVYPFVAVGLLIMVFLPRLDHRDPRAADRDRGPHRGRAGVRGAHPQRRRRGRAADEPADAALARTCRWTMHTLSIIAPYALAVALVGLLESLLTAKLVDDITDTHSNKTRESWGQGVANVVTGLFGGMGGCAMIGQTMINVKVSGARTRISTFLAGLFLLGLVVGLGDVVGLIPMAALVAVMIMVSVGTIDWHSITPVDAAPDAAQRDAGHGRHRGGHRRDQQPRLRRDRRSADRDGALRAARRAPRHRREGRPAQTSSATPSSTA